MLKLVQDTVDFVVFLRHQYLEKIKLKFRKIYKLFIARYLSLKRFQIYNLSLINFQEN